MDVEYRTVVNTIFSLTVSQKALLGKMKMSGKNIHEMKKALASFHVHIWTGLFTFGYKSRHAFLIGIGHLVLATAGINT